jgi:FkbM family methyltransferase
VICRDRPVTVPKWRGAIRRVLRDVSRTRVPGRYLAIEALAFAYAGDDEPLVRIGSHGALACDLKDQVQRQIYFGVYDEPESRLVRALAPSCEVCLDIGANVGYYTLLMANLVCPGGTVHAFEPIPALADRLAMNVERSELSNVRLNRAAVSARVGHLELFVREGVSNSGWASIVPSATHRNMPLKVPALTIDEYVTSAGLSHVDLIKLDIEGAEPGALAGGSRLLSGHDAPDILCELNPYLLSRAGSSVGDLQRLFSRFGYRLYRIGRSHCAELDGEVEPVFMNVIATKHPARIAAVLSAINPVIVVSGLASETSHLQRLGPDRADAIGAWLTGDFWE